MRGPGSPSGEAQEDDSPASPQGLPGQDATGASSTILPWDKLAGWCPTSSMPGRPDISGCDRTHPPPQQVPVPSIPQPWPISHSPTKMSRKGCKLAGAPISLTENLWCGNVGTMATESPQNHNRTWGGPTPQQNSEKESSNSTQGH